MTEKQTDERDPYRRDQLFEKIAKGVGNMPTQMPMAAGSLTAAHLDVHIQFRDESDCSQQGESPQEERLQCIWSGVLRQVYHSTSETVVNLMDGHGGLREFVLDHEQQVILKADEPHDIRWKGLA